LSRNLDLSQKPGEPRIQHSYCFERYEIELTAILSSTQYKYILHRATVQCRNLDRK